MTFDELLELTGEELIKGKDRTVHSLDVTGAPPFVRNPFEAWKSLLDNEVIIAYQVARYKWTAPGERVELEPSTVLFFGPAGDKIRTYEEVT